ncbi:hypothetical protein SAMN02745945_01859 [Peptoclostridium litorale DSM 5388]|uniref:Uncharacterized protein n=1 Tax=Peptoclostridium litorale DSM 5388 TaxID=1121324 RepID=A0A069RNW1_PEPLI|nr:hypothetical protein [Peptoclostridium litorale]KDR95867.1 hypothetical protein CLIT_8c00360 [Peptoclostridium litorale DSM 5388]SIO11054.1 hypothetical protein SAMN02745945_01859 [Peptoclostridium litorale DSM 5388]
MLSGVIYKIFLNKEGSLDIAEIHEEDYVAWEGRDFMTDGNGNELRFDSKMEAAEWMRENCVPELISYEFKKVDWSAYRKK